MKNASQIITMLQNKPQFSKLKKYKCIQKIQSMFMPSFTRFVKFAYLQNNTLFFVLNHNAGKQEFNNASQSIKSVLKLHTPSECIDTPIEDIKAFVTHVPMLNTQTAPQVRQIYKEKGTGEVKVLIHDERLHKLVQSIQDIIKEKNKNR
jgi:hypothetical protein